ncbi:MAG: hypothetical protein LBH25_02825 [Fibromonadaceae bacterium]|jgi:hypothetical protein|nr:hypothetical protein [Fibromonadaceae bacterium]
MNLERFASKNLFEATQDLFAQLGIKLNTKTKCTLLSKNVLKKYYKEDNPFTNINELYFVGLVDDSVFDSTEINDYQYETAIEVAEKSDNRYDGLMLYAIELNKTPNRGEIAKLTRAFNQVSKAMPVGLVIKYEDKISITMCERIRYLQEWRRGEKVGKIIILKDIDIQNTSMPHIKILSGLKIDPNKVKSYTDLAKYWQKQFSIQTLNKAFYEELQQWFYFAKKEILLPYKPEYIDDDDDNNKSFLVRLLTRIMFCWFIKEKGLIPKELLELTDYRNNRFKLTNDVESETFLQSNSYYHGILQNIFFKSLNEKEKKSSKDFNWKKYLHSNFDFSWFINIPYLNGGIFDKLEVDDYNCKEKIEDNVIKIPNFLFYGNEKQKGLNQIFNSYKFTLEENTPYEEDIALDPELLGLVFENLLAELDPNLEESAIKNIKKETGSYYTPRKVVQEMVNESLFIYLKKHVTPEQITVLSDLIFKDEYNTEDNDFSNRIVTAIDKFKMLDPACGSGAFPMGMLHKLVEILYYVDKNNEKWIDLKLQSVDPNYRDEFKKTLVLHRDNYSRKLGIIRDSIYGIDIQPLAVQITKLRFFISLLIDQKSTITPMPNIETKIICADSLKNIAPDFFSNKSIDELIEVRRKYYQPGLSHDEKEQIAEKIAEELNKAFPSFSKQITGKSISGQNKELIHKWFTHGTLAAPFFNMDFFYPELKGQGFDCVIGNPPYGGKDIKDEVRMVLFGANENDKNKKNLKPTGSKDPYGAFISRFLSSHISLPPLKDGGVLAFIVSDTFMTIKSHLPLRKQMMSNYIHKMIRVHPDTFRATVNTAIIICERNCKKEFDTSHICQMVDMTNISIHEDYNRFTEIMHETEGIDLGTERKAISNTEYAIYYYPQQLIKTNSNLPFFVASPKLFALMNDGNVKNQLTDNVKVSYENNNLKMYKLGDDYIGNAKKKVWSNIGLFKIVSGIKTGNNIKYLGIIKSNAQKNFEIVNNNNILLESDILKLTENEKQNGIKYEKTWVKFEMGMPSDSNNGALPCYYQDESFIVINWSYSTVSDMKKEKHSDLANSEFRFLPISKQISFSFTGQYAPTFRIAAAPIFLNASSRILLSDKSDVKGWLGFLNSKIFRFLSKSYINHTVNFGIDDMKSVLSINKYDFLEIFVSKIMQNQQSNPRYDYASNEQIEIDKLVYEAYGLSPEDVEEVENWYARRYPKLSEAQKQNLRKLGKSDDYLVLYGYKKL